MTSLEIQEVAKLDLEKMRLESALNVLRGLEAEGEDRLHVDGAMSVLRARIDRIDGILREGEIEL